VQHHRTSNRIDACTLGIPVLFTSQAQAESNFQNVFLAAHPATHDTALDNCQLCHTALCHQRERDGTATISAPRPGVLSENNFANKCCLLGKVGGKMLPRSFVKFISIKLDNSVRSCYILRNFC
jgi:hypothetical protein